MVHTGQEVVMIGGMHALHRHEKLAIALSKAMRSHSLQETKTDGRFHVHTRTYLDGAILKEEMERSADVLAPGLLEMSNPSLSSKFFLQQLSITYLHLYIIFLLGCNGGCLAGPFMDESDGSSDSFIKHKPLWATYSSKRGKDKKKRAEEKKQKGLYQTYGTRIIPV
ncbi:hypothetical protein CsSME_00021072 [Camellia sinensis var. sinensis]